MGGQPHGDPFNITMNSLWHRAGQQALRQGTHKTPKAGTHAGQDPGRDGATPASQASHPHDRPPGGRDPGLT